MPSEQTGDLQPLSVGGQGLASSAGATELRFHRMLLVFVKGGHRNRQAGRRFLALVRLLLKVSFFV